MRMDEYSYDVRFKLDRSQQERSVENIAYKRIEKFNQQLKKYLQRDREKSRPARKDGDQ